MYNAGNGGLMEAHFSFQTIFIHFPVHNIRLTAKASAPLERTGNFGLETVMDILSFVFLYVISAFEGH
jgi:hypothetical protein